MGKRFAGRRFDPRGGYRNQLAHVAPADVPIYVTGPRAWWRADSRTLQSGQPTNVETLVAKYDATHVATLNAAQTRGVVVASYARFGGAPAVYFQAGGYTSNRPAAWWQFLVGNSSTVVHIVDTLDVNIRAAVCLTNNVAQPLANEIWEGGTAETSTRRESVNVLQSPGSGQVLARKARVSSGTLQVRVNALTATAAYASSGAALLGAWCICSRAVPSGIEAAFRWAESIYWDYQLTPAQVTGKLVPYLGARYGAGVAAGIAGWTD